MSYFNTGQFDKAAPLFEEELASIEKETGK